MMKSVKFGNKNALEIIDTDLKKNIKDFLWEKARTKPTDKNYRSLNYGSLHHLSKYPHLVTLSTYGKKFLLVLMKVEEKNQTIFIDRKREMMIYMPMGFDSALYQGTVLDGELIKDNKGQWIYFITDIILYKGKSTYQVALKDRIEVVRKIFKSYFQENELDFCQFQMKDYFPYKYLEDLCQGYRNRLHYKCSGIIFKNQIKTEKALLYIFPENRTQPTLVKSTSTASSAPVVASKNGNGSGSGNGNEDVSIMAISVSEQMSESETFTEQNRNFTIAKTELPDVYNLFAKNDKGDAVKIGFAAITSIDVSQYVNQLFQKEDADSMVVTCRYVKRFKKWEPICLSQEEISTIE